MEVETGGQDVLVTWYPSHGEPEGLHHRALVAAGLLEE
jgi:hypothetical protein